MFRKRELDTKPQRLATGHHDSLGRALWREPWSCDPMATRRDDLIIRPGWRYTDHDGALVEVDGIYGVDGCSSPVAEVRYHRIADGTKHRVFHRFAAQNWHAVPADMQSDDQQASRQPTGAVIVFLVGAFVIAALVVLARWW